MKVLHLFSNWKWTGPAEPAVNLAAELNRRGHEVSFACGQAPDDNRKLVHDQAVDRGLEPLRGLHLRKHRHPWFNRKDVQSLRRLIHEDRVGEDRVGEDRVDVVHTHLDNDHLIAARAMEKIKNPPVLVRTHYAGDPEELRYLPRLLSRTDGLASVSRAVLEAIGPRARSSGTELFHVEGAIDLDRFSPGPPLSPEDGLAIGVVARMQTHRRFEVLLDAFSRVARERANVSLHIIGRGTNQEKVAMEPVRRMGLSDRVRFLGYLKGDDYVTALRKLCALVYLVPGSDGSCRTVREGMACGLPVIASKRGILRELVQDGIEGYSVEEDGQDLASAMLSLVSDHELRKRMSVRVAEVAQTRFGLPRQATLVEQIYDTVVRRARGGH